MRAPVVLVHADVAGVAAVGGGQRNVVGGRQPHMDGEAHPLVRALDPAVDLVQHVGQRLARDRVLHLAEHHPPRRAEHPVGAVDVLPFRQRPAGQPIGTADQLGTCGGEPVDAAEHRVGEQFIVQPAFDPAEWLGLGVDRHPGVGLGQHPAGVREPVELEVVAGLQHAEHFQQVVVVGRRLHRVQQERRLALQGDGGDDAQRAEGDPGGGEDVRVLLGRAVQQLAVGGHQLQATHLGGQPAERAAGAVRAGGDRAADRLGIQLAQIGHRKAHLPQRNVQFVQGGAGGHRDQAGGPVGADDAGQQAEIHHHAAGHRDVGEAVPGAHRLYR